MRPLDRQLIPELGPEAEATRLRLREALTKKVLQVESWMFDEQEIHHREALPLSEERIKRIHVWLDVLALGEESIPEDLDEKVVGQTVEEYTELLTALLDVREGKSLSGKMRRYEFDLAPDEFLINPEDIPLLNRQHPLEDIRKGFGLHVIGNEYSDAIIKSEVLLSGLRTECTELLPAKIFDITPFIERKYQEALARKEMAQNKLSYQELFAAFDEAGVRPATFKELLAYAKKFWRSQWQPQAHLSPSLSPEEAAQKANARRVYGVGSMFCRANSSEYVPVLIWQEGRTRRLSSSAPEFWIASDRFLVFRNK